MDTVKSIAEQLRDSAVSTSNAYKSIARNKSLRQSDDQEQRDDLCNYPKVEETLEYKAALYIESLESKLKENGVVVEWDGDEVKNGPSLLSKRISIEVPDGIDNESLKTIIEDFVARNGSQLDNYSSSIQIKPTATPETKWPFLSDPKICRALGVAARVGFEKALHLSDDHLSDPNQFTRDEWTKVEEVILGLENTQ